jgi:hypothetical protein
VPSQCTHRVIHNRTKTAIPSAIHLPHVITATILSSAHRSEAFAKATCSAIRQRASAIATSHKSGLQVLLSHQHRNTIWSTCRPVLTAMASQVCSTPCLAGVLPYAITTYIWYVPRTIRKQAGTAGQPADTMNYQSGVLLGPAYHAH